MAVAQSELAAFSYAYAYDALDQLIAVSRVGAVVERYGYDSFGRRAWIATSDARMVGGESAANDNMDAEGFTRLAVVSDGPDRALDLVQGQVGAPILLRRVTHDAQIDTPLELEVTGAGAGTPSIL